MGYKNIIFDVGGVLLSYRWLGIIMETIPDEGEARAFARRLFDDPLWLEFDIELRPFDDVVEDYVRKYPEDEEHIRYVLGHLERMPLPRKRTWEKIHDLKRAGYSLYLLSNYSSRMFHAHTDGLPFLDDMDGHIISYEVHQLKPDKEIYESLFKKYSLDPSECFFFDDRQENVDSGRLCGMEGRVIHSEELLLGYLDRLLAKDGISNVFHDTSFTPEERITWLLSRMTVEEKIILYSHPEQGVGRFGVEGFVLGGEASHGVDARNDQNGIINADITTSFPNPIGMSSSWDLELIGEAGRITGTEARASFLKHRKTGLSRWAPTIDMERDPRWGRNEEGYGEDPCLTAINASAFIKGMRGEDPNYIRCASTLKHYYANNVEDDRMTANSSIGMRDKFEYYLPPFMQAIEKAGAVGIMTAYNKVNGIPEMTDPEIKTLLKERYGLIHAVSDGFALVRLKAFHHEYGTLAECLAASVKAGVDCMNEKPEEVEKALRDAVDLSLLSEKDLDEALKNIFMVWMKLGVYDPPEDCPFNEISSADTDTEDSRDICRRLSEESVVLLENKNNVLPLSKDNAGKISFIGPQTDEWQKDWYGGIPPFRHTVYDGVSSVLNRECNCLNGLDKFRIYTDGKPWVIGDDGSISLDGEDEGDLFYITDWGEGFHTIRSVSTDKYVQSVFYGTDGKDGNPGRANRGLLRADREDVFDWFTTCRFYIKYSDNDTVEITDRFEKRVAVTDEGKVKADDTLHPVNIRLEKISDGIEEAKLASESSDIIVLVLGCNPLIPAREDYDRTCMGLPPSQQKILDSFADSGKTVIVVLLSNYPYTFNGAEKKVDAMLLSATGSEYMGDAVAAALFGDISPAGRLVQGWPVSESVLPDINDYRIIGSRTYRYVTKGWMYPFGYGLSYGDISYSDMTVSDDGDGCIRVNVGLENKGIRTTDEVVQIYAKADFTDEKLTDAGYGRRLIAFRRIKGLKPGESRIVEFLIEKKELQLFDVVTGQYFVYGGEYCIFAGHNAFSEAVQSYIHIKGQYFAERDLSCLVPVYACDNYNNVEFIKGCFGLTAASVQNGKAEAGLFFINSRLSRNASKVYLLIRSEDEGRVDIIWNGNTIAVWAGNTSSPGKEMTVYELPTERTVEPRHWPAYWTEVICDLDNTDRLQTGELSIRLSGDIRVLGIKCL